MVRDPPSLCFSSCGLDSVTVFRQFLAYVNISEPVIGWIVIIQHGLQLNCDHPTRPSQCHAPCSATLRPEEPLPRMKHLNVLISSMTSLVPDSLICVPCIAVSWDSYVELRWHCFLINILLNNFRNFCKIFRILQCISVWRTMMCLPFTRNM
jgi:hypothetical protein